MKDDNWESSKARITEAYNPPPDVPRDAMWRQIEARLPAAPEADEHADERSGVLSIEGHQSVKSATERRGGATWRRNTLLAAAAGGALWIGFGLGRATTPEAPLPAPAMPETAEMPMPAQVRPDAGSTRFATARHLAASRSLLTVVGSEAEAGAIDPNVAALATLLLTQTRLMLDSSAGQDDETVTLLEDLELVLIQVVHASKAGAAGGSEVGRMEMQQLSKGLQDNNVLPRIQRLLPPVMAGAADD